LFLFLEECSPSYNSPTDKRKTKNKKNKCLKNIFIFVSYFDKKEGYGKISIVSRDNLKLIFYAMIGR
jgi:hypothetical protein